MREPPLPPNTACLRPTQPDRPFHWASERLRDSAARGRHGTLGSSPRLLRGRRGRGSHRPAPPPRRNRAGRWVWPAIDPGVAGWRGRQHSKGERRRMWGGSIGSTTREIDANACSIAHGNRGWVGGGPMLLLATSWTLVSSRGVCLGLLACTGTLSGPSSQTSKDLIGIPQHTIFEQQKSPCCACEQQLSLLPHSMGNSSHQLSARWY